MKSNYNQFLSIYDFLVYGETRRFVLVEKLTEKMINNKNKTVLRKQIENISINFREQIRTKTQSANYIITSSEVAQYMDEIMIDIKVEPKVALEYIDINFTLTGDTLVNI